MLTRKSKYRLVGELTSGFKGTLLDVGARDRALLPYLSGGLTYAAADAAPGLDLQWNLEEPLPSADRSYDVVVALDVLEHVENIHRALRELLRVARDRVYISLPNMSCLSLRVQFLLHGSLGAKYDLLPSHQGDRHRWLTRHGESCVFVESIARDMGWRVERWDILEGFGRLHGAVSHLPLPPSLRVYLSLFELKRGESAG